MLECSPFLKALGHKMIFETDCGRNISLQVIGVRTYFCLLYPELVWKITEVSGKFLDRLESFQIVLNVSELSGKFQFCLEIFRIVWKV